MPPTMGEVGAGVLPVRRSHTRPRWEPCGSSAPVLAIVGGAPSNGRIGNVSDVVDAIIYLDGAEFVTGEILHVDGGQAAGHHMVQGA